MKAKSATSNYFCPPASSSRALKNRKNGGHLAHEKKTLIFGHSEERGFCSPARKPPQALPASAMIPWTAARLVVGVAGFWWFEGSHQGEMEGDMGVDPKIVGFVTPQIIHFHRVWKHYFHHPFWGLKTPIFGNTHSFGWWKPSKINHDFGTKKNSNDFLFWLEFGGWTFKNRGFLGFGCRYTYNRPMDPMTIRCTKGQPFAGRNSCPPSWCVVPEVLTASRWRRGERWRVGWVCGGKMWEVMLIQSGATQNDHRVDFRKGIEIVQVHIAGGCFKSNPPLRLPWFCIYFTVVKWLR